MFFAMYPINYSTKRLTLRELATHDIDVLSVIQGDVKATEHLSFEPQTRDQVMENLGRSMAAARADPRAEYDLAVTLPMGGDLIGIARLATDPHQQQAATIGFVLHPDHWGRGLGTETVRALMGVGFEVLGLHRLWAARGPLNMASHRTMVKAGMVQEGMIREHLFVYGAWRDSITYSILEQEWRAG